ncbi:GNAT family N-acetyltransferase [Virgibacillus phasianinus]|uniref:GNAT family N-acetyltransferase n=1 Tax=Virgibacillus phasianinus TaxID=2017483 RepID=UPI001560DCC1|nr:GNAT family N-acetyltransferase [Virgibacillus phasianinus]
MIESERCWLEFFRQSDCDDVEKLYRNPRVRRYLGGVPSEDLIDKSLYDMLHPDGDSFYWMAREKQSKESMGLISLDPHHEGVNLEISFQFLPEWWGAGFATEAVQSIIHYAFNDLKLSKVVAETQTANTSSRRLLEGIGMNFEKTIIRFGEEQAVYCIEP